MCSECLYFLHYPNFQFFKVAGNNLLLGKERFILFFKQYTIIILTVLEVRSLRWVSMGLNKDYQQNCDPFRNLSREICSLAFFRF